MGIGAGTSHFARREQKAMRVGSSQNKLSQMEGIPLGVTVMERTASRPFNQRAIDILSNPERGIIPSVSAGRITWPKEDYFSCLAGSDQGYPLEKAALWQAFDGRAHRWILKPTLLTGVPLEVQSIRMNWQMIGGGSFPGYHRTGIAG
jgi:hypothetical protein